MLQEKVKLQRLNIFQENTDPDIDRTSKVLRGEKNVDIVYIDNEDTWNDWGNTLADLTTNYVGVYDNVVVDNVSELERCILSSLGAEGKTTAFLRKAIINICNLEW